MPPTCDWQPGRVETTPLKVCLLEADDLPPHLTARFVGYGKMFRDLLENKQPVPVETEVFRVYLGEYPSDDRHFDAYLVTGSKADAFADVPWILNLGRFCAQKFAQGARLLGVCFGHQLLSHYLGGKTERANCGWGVGEQLYRVVGPPRHWMHPQLKQVRLEVSHKDQVTRLPPNADIFLTNDFCRHAGYTIGNQVFSVQGHLEFPDDYLFELVKVRKEILGNELYEKAMKGRYDELSKFVVAEWMMRFVLLSKQDEEMAQ